MNSEEIKLTKYLHDIVEDNISLRIENDRLWKQKLEYIDRINKTINFINSQSPDAGVSGKKIKEILKGDIDE